VILQKDMGTGIAMAAIIEMKTLAMPSLCDATSFGLDDEAHNRKTGLAYLKRKPAVVETLDNSVLYRYGDAHNGVYFLWSSEEQLIHYYMRYKQMRKFHGVSVTQTSLWRSLTSADAEGLSHHVIYNYLLVQYPALVSDQIQTERGRDFWIKLLTKSLKGNKYDVSLVDFNSQQIHKIELAAELRLWLTSEDDNPWSWYSMKHKGLRFMISRKGAIK
jgi:hypothetical protein